MPTDILPLILALVLGYLAGSIPFGLILTQAAGLGDIRKIGSGNIGATNVLRTGNRPVAAATLVLDALKAAIPVLVARYFWGEDAAMLAAVGAFFGHCFPVWLGFKGGKGVAVMIGSLLSLAWPVGLIHFLHNTLGHAFSSCELLAHMCKQIKHELYRQKYQSLLIVMMCKRGHVSAFAVACSHQM
ncbi:MAG: glycerol-3-phosphate acyltransferase [Hyphomicrobiales bacterium]|nr:MAG: glycerol-3-phosphate acyltransferase [Hyphomicrobiales bacterium]